MKLNIINKQTLDRAAQALAALDLSKRWTLSITEQKTRRSLDQNALYWKWVDCIRLHILDSTGQAYSADDVHEHMKAKLLPSKVVTIGDDSIRCRLSTTKLSVDEMSAYLEQIDRYCSAELGLYLPQPGMEDL